MATGIARIAVQSAGLSTGTAYSALDQVGTIFTVAGCAVGAGGTGTLQSLQVNDTSSTTSTPFILWVFRSNPTLAADNAAFSISDADANALICPPIFLDTITSYVNGSSQGRNEINRLYDCASTSLFVAVQAASSRVAFGAATDLELIATVNVAS